MGYSGQSHFNRPGTGPAYKNTDPGYILKILRVPILWLFHSEARMPKSAKLFKRFRAAATNERLDLSLSWRASEDPLKKLYRI